MSQSGGQITPLDKISGHFKVSNVGVSTREIIIVKISTLEIFIAQTRKTYFLYT